MILESILSNTASFINKKFILANYVIITSLNNSISAKVNEVLKIQGCYFYYVLLYIRTGKIISPKRKLRKKSISPYFSYS
jgi:hypothetical protein